MNIVHINTVIGRGGAAVSTQTLCDAQNRAGDVASIFAAVNFVGHRQTTTFNPAPDEALRAATDVGGLQYHEFQGSHRLIAHPLVRSADVIHCHNLHGGYFNPFSLIPLAHFKPVVWTLRDMHAITGHCVHALDCERWISGCGSCPDLGAPAPLTTDSTALLWAQKATISSLSPLVLACPSVWLKEKVERSFLANHPVAVVPNGTDTVFFSPGNKEKAKRALGIRADVPVVGTVSELGTANVWKGGTRLLATAREIQERLPTAVIVSVGNENVAANGEWAGRMLKLPRIYDRSLLREVYNSFDCYLSTSVADNCPVSVIEALACGVPVVAFRTGGIPELVRDGCEGVIVAHSDVFALGAACASLLADESRRSRMVAEARRRAVAHYDMRRVREDYNRLYLQAIERRAAGAFSNVASSDVAALPRHVMTTEFIAAMREAGLTSSLPRPNE